MRDRVRGELDPEGGEVLEQEHGDCSPGARLDVQNKDRHTRNERMGGMDASIYSPARLLVRRLRSPRLTSSGERKIVEHVEVDVCVEEELATLFENGVRRPLGVDIVTTILGYEVTRT